jgi:hypothetical protein
MPWSDIPAARAGKDPVPRSGRRRPAWALAALLAILVAVPPAAAQNGGEKPQLFFSQDPEGVVGAVNRLRLRPNVLTKLYLHVRSEGGPAAKYEVALFAGEKRVPGVAQELPKLVKGINHVIFGKAPPPKDKDKDGKPAPLPLKEAPGPLSVRLLDAKGLVIDTVPIGVAAPKEYVTVDAVSFDPGGSEDGKKNVLEVRLSARPNFAGDPARVELVLPPERIPDLIPGQKKEGSYGGLLKPGQPLVLRAEDLKFREAGQLKQGLFYVNIDGYPRAFSFVSSFAAEKTTSQPREVTPPVMRLAHPEFAKPGAKLPVVVEVDNMPGEAYGTLTMYREYKKGKAPAGPEGEPRRFTGDRAQALLYNAAGPEGTLVFDSKVGDHAFQFDTKDIFGVRFLAASMIDKAQEAAKEPDPRIPVLDSKKIPALGLTGGTKSIVEPVLLYEGGPDLVLDVDLPPVPPGKLPELFVGAPVPLKAVARDPTGVVNAVFFQGKPLPDGKLPPAVVEGEKVPDEPGVWVAEMPAPTDRALLMTVSVQVTNGVGDKAVKTIRIQLVDPKAKPAPTEAKLATVTGTVFEGDRPQAGVPVTLGDAKGELKAATKTDEKGAYKFEKVAPGVYTVNALRTASMTRGRTLISVPVGVELVNKNTDVKLTR